MGDPYLVKIQKHELKELRNGRKEQYLKNSTFYLMLNTNPQLYPPKMEKHY